MPVLPPETLEGWYALHQVFRIDRRFLRELGDDRAACIEEFTRAVSSSKPAQGWTAAVALASSSAELMVIHFRESLDEIAVARRQLEHLHLYEGLIPEYSFLSVTEAGLYHVTAQLAREAKERGGQVGDDAYAAALAQRVYSEHESAHVRRRLYPPLPAEMPYVCFYPMSKRRNEGQNWYALTLDERSQLMRAHGETGRRYAGRVQQVISGAIGFDAWEWGVTLFAKDPLDFKKLVTDMRFDEVSAKYAEFGDFFVGRVASHADLLDLFG